MAPMPTTRSLDCASLAGVPEVAAAGRPRPRRAGAADRRPRGLKNIRTAVDAASLDEAAEFALYMREKKLTEALAFASKSQAEPAGAKKRASRRPAPSAEEDQHYEAEPPLQDDGSIDTAAVPEEVQGHPTRRAAAALAKMEAAIEVVAAGAPTAALEAAERRARAREIRQAELAEVEGRRLATKQWLDRWDGDPDSVSAPTTDLDSSAPSPKKSSDGRMTHAERDAERENMESFQGRYARNFTSAKEDGLSACFPHYSDAEKMRMEILRATMA